MITETRTHTPARTGMVWYRDEHDRRAHFPVMLANRRGIHIAPGVDPADIPDDAHALAATVHQTLTTNPRARLNGAAEHHTAAR